MKKITLALLSLAAIFSVSSFKCTKGDSLHCEAVLCTQVFASVMVHVDDLSASPIALDVYTVRNSTGEKLTFGQFSSTSGTYNIMDDSYRAKLAGRTETFTFVGMKGSTKVFSQSYTIKADCCHVYKVSGADSITIP